MIIILKERGKTMKNNCKLLLLSAFTCFSIGYLTCVSVSALDDQRSTNDVPIVENTQNTDTSALNTSDNVVYNGWVQEDSGIYYYENGEKVTDKLLFWTNNSVNNAYGCFYLDNNGKMVTKAWKELKNNDGKMVWYYFGENGVAYSGGTYNINGTNYYFTYESVLYSDSAGSTYAVERNGDNLIKVRYDGVVVSTKQIAYGQITEFNGSMYYYEEDNYYYSQQVEISGKKYYVVDGLIKTNMLVPTYDYDDGYSQPVGYQAYGNNGVLITNNWYQDLSSSNKDWYYFDENGNAVTGWKNIGGNKYYFTENFSMLYGGTYEIDGTIYKFDTSGAVIQTLTSSKDGWVASGDEWFYFKDGERYTGWVQSSGLWYYTKDGLMIKNTFYTITNADGVDESYIFNKDGVMLKNQWYKETYYDEYSSVENEIWFYAQGSGALYENCWQWINGAWYYFDISGVMLTGNNEIYNEETGEMEIHQFAASGAWIKELSKPKNGWIEIYDNEWMYYIDNVPVKEDWKWIGGAYYYFDEYGIACFNGVYKIDDIFYVFDKNCKLLERRGWYHNGNSWYYANEKGEALKDWQWINGAYYYLDNNSCYAWSNSTISWKDKLYAFNDDCAMVSNGWHKFPYSENNWVYADSAGHLATGWKYINGSWYFFNEYDGRMYTGYEYTDEENGWCFFSSSGAWINQKIDMSVEGWKQVGDYWYYAKDGELVYNQWIITNGKTYYISWEDNMSTDDIVYFSNYYYDSNIQSIVTNQYFAYLDKNGVLVTNGDFNYYNETYHADKYGYALYYTNYYYY